MRLAEGCHPTADDVGHIGVPPVAAVVNAGHHNQPLSPKYSSLIAGGPLDHDGSRSRTIPKTGMSDSSSAAVTLA